MATAYQPEYLARKHNLGPIIVIAFFTQRAAVLATALVVSALTSGTPAAAQPPLGCTVGTLGVTACLGSKLCACTYDRGGIVSGIPAGYRWDCSILRPGCSGSVHPPATLNPYEGPYPQALSIDKSRHSVTVQQTNTDAKAGIKTNIRSNSKDRAPEAWHGAPLPLLPPD